VRSVIFHAAFLVVALVAAFLTWTAGEETDTSGAPIEVWSHEADDVAAVVYREGERTVRLERRADGDETYLWGMETLADSAGAPAETFPVGDAGDAVIADLATLRALRDLGEASAERRATFGLVDPVATVTLHLQDGEERGLAVGGSVVGDGHRYALDTQADKLYVLPADVIRPLEVGGSALRLTELQPFDPDDVASAAIHADGFDRSMERRLTGVPPRATWVHPGTDRLDQTFTTFMDQLDNLWVVQYQPDLGTDTLRSLMRAAYLDTRGDTIGILELFRTRADSLPRYFLRTRRTIVPGEVHASIAERVEQDLETLRSTVSRD
jgi:Domain of unknown function (DUF4340)